MVAIGRFKLDHTDDYAEIAFVVHDRWQNAGVGTYLMGTLISIAKDMGAHGFKADVLAENKKMLHVFHKCGCPVHSLLEEGIYSIRIDFTTERRKSGERRP
jgi:GNAT superfamily N-acetyltransferase